MSVVIATKDRPAFIARCLDALAQQDLPPQEIIVVDQSGDPSTRQACAGHGSAVRHVPDAGTGQSRARNIGVALAEGELIACLDDDCYAGPGWSRAFQELLSRRPEAAGAFGAMLPSADLPAGVGGIEVSTITFPGEVVHRSRRPPYEVGYGGNFVLRRDWWRRLGDSPCDELLDPGSPNPGAGDMDLIHRLLRDGAVLVSTPAAWAIHDQWRPSSGLARKMLGYGRGSGAYLGKHILSGDAYALALLMRQIAADLRLSASGLRRRSPLRAQLGVFRLAGTLRGLGASGALARRRTARR